MAVVDEATASIDIAIHAALDTLRYGQRRQESIALLERAAEDLDQLARDWRRAERALRQQIDWERRAFEPSRFGERP